MTAPTTGQYGEEGEFDADTMFDDVAAALSAGDEKLPAPRPVPEQTPDGGDDTAPIPKGGPLLEEKSPAKLFRVIDGKVQRQERVAKNREQKALHYRRIRSGHPFAFLEKSEDRSVYTATVPPGSDKSAAGQPVPNKMDDVANKTVSQLLSDPYLPNPKADGDDDRDRGAADLAKKFLRADGTATGTDDGALQRDVLNMNMTDGSSFVVVWVDPTGGGWRPKQVQAHPRATDPSRPLYAPMLDKATGQPIPTADGSLIEEKSAEPVLRYVAEVGKRPETSSGLAFTDNASEAVRQWLPKHCRRILNVNQVRTFPQSSDVFSASEIALLMYDSLDEAKRRFPVLRTMKDHELKAVCQWRPRRWKSVVPEAHRTTDAGADTAKPVEGDSLVFWYEYFCRISPDYPDGAQVCVNGANLGGAQSADGSGVVFSRDTLRDDVELEDGRTIPVLRCPPVTQFVANTDIEDGDPFGMAPMARFGGGKEAWDHIWSGLFDAMHKGLNPNVFLPSTSPVTKEDYNRRDGTPIEILTKDDQPFVEEPPVLPVFVPDLLERIEMTINSAAGLNETSTGLDSEYSTSGVAKDIAIKQARVALAQYWQNFVKGLTHYWYVKLQLAQAKLTVPQVVKLAGTNSAYKQSWFTGADLCGVGSVTLEPGTGTQMQPAEKAQLLTVMQTNLWIDPTRAAELARASMSDDLGLAPDVHEEAIDREIAAWSDGPTPEWLAQFAEQQRVMQEYEAQARPALQHATEQTGDPAVAEQLVAQVAPPPQLPPLPTPFVARPNNAEQAVAIARHARLTKVMSTIEYAKQPDGWKQLLDAAYDEARRAAGVATIAEQQEAMAAQAAAEQGPAGPDPEQKAAADKEKTDKTFDDKAADRESKERQADLDRQNALELEARKSANAAAAAAAPTT